MDPLSLTKTSRQDETTETRHDLLTGGGPLRTGEVEERGGEGGEEGEEAVSFDRHHIAEDIQQNYTHLYREGGERDCVYVYVCV